MFEIISNYEPKDSFEIEDKKQFLQAISLFKEELVNRHPMMHFTASSIIFNETFDQMLMIYHKMYDSWSWTGGHLDGNMDFLEVAKKEAIEETGVSELKVISSSPVGIEALPVWFHVKRGLPVSSHMHLNVSFAFVASDKTKLIINHEETNGVRWIKISEYKKYVTEPEMFPIYDKIIKRVINHD